MNSSAFLHLLDSGLGVVRRLMYFQTSAALTQMRPKRGYAYQRETGMLVRPSNPPGFPCRVGYGEGGGKYYEGSCQVSVDALPVAETRKER